MVTKSPFSQPQVAQQGWAVWRNPPLLSDPWLPPSLLTSFLISHCPSLRIPWSPPCILAGGLPCPLFKP